MAFLQLCCPIEHSHMSLVKLHTTDIDRDGCWEIVTLTVSSSQWQLTVWQFRPTERRFITLAQLTLSSPTQLSRPSKPSVGSAIVKPSQPTNVLEPNLYIADIDGDGLKDFIVVWMTKFLYPMCGLARHNLSPPECVAVQVVWWQGRNLRSRSFLPHEVAFPKLLTNLWTLNEHRLAIVGAVHGKRRLTFRLLSLRPLRVQLWETETEQRCAVLRIHTGDAALDLRRWTKLAELPASPRLWGDWDRDGKLEFLFEQTFVQSLRLTLFRKMPVFVQTATHSVLHLARWNGRR
ncbi:MAG: hypothetical protein ACK40X_12410, partial [Armatimonadota bacterium]